MKKGCRRSCIGIGILIVVACGGFVGYLYFPWIGATPYNAVVFSMNGFRVDDFAYILQYEEFADRESTISLLQDSPYDLLIIDPFYDADSPWTAGEIADIQFHGDEKRVLAYVSIGEAESYRFYWNQSWDADADGIPDPSAPAWLDQENPDWKGNYKVRYWDPAWQAMIFGSPSAYVDRILQANFTGVYLDIIDAFEYYEDQEIADAAERMVDFVCNLSAYTKTIKSPFQIFVQNGERLGESSRYMNAIDGLGREDVIFSDNWPQTSADRTFVESFLYLFRDAGKILLQIEYPTIPRFIRQSYEYGFTHGMLVYVGPRSLDLLVTHDQYLPT